MFFNDRVWPADHVRRGQVLIDNNIEINGNIIGG